MRENEITQEYTSRIEYECFANTHFLMSDSLKNE